ncbi:MAG: ParB/RepB/Spo0J family partition protein [Bacteroidia bacterium]
MSTNQRPVMVKVEDLIPNPLNFYKSSEHDKLAMADSVREHGVKTAIVAKPDKDNPGKFIIISGHLRVTGSIMAGLHEVPCIIEEYDTEEEELNALVIGNEYRTKTKLEIASEMNARKRIWALGGVRSDLYFKEGERPLSTRARLAVRYKMSEATVGKYELIFDAMPKRFTDIDNGDMSIDGAYNLINYLNSEDIMEPDDVKMQRVVVEHRAPHLMKRVNENKLPLELAFYAVVRGLSKLKKPKVKAEGEPGDDEKEPTKKTATPAKTETPAPIKDQDEKVPKGAENQKKAEEEEDEVLTYRCKTLDCPCYDKLVSIVEDDGNTNEEESQK